MTQRVQMSTPNFGKVEVQISLRNLNSEIGLGYLHKTLRSLVWLTTCRVRPVGPTNRKAVRSVGAWRWGAVGRWVEQTSERAKFNLFSEK